MPACCVCYTTDRTYLFPTLVSAMQARRNSNAAAADVAIFVFGADSAAMQAFGPVCEVEGIKLIELPPDAIDHAPAMLARLFLDRFVDPQYQHFLYIDGDTQISGALDPLIGADVPAGRFMAANDPMTFALPGKDALSRDVAQHFAAMGIRADVPYSYFNTGVLRIARQGWDEIGTQAWTMFRDQTSARFPDQDVLNIIANDRRIPMSLAWNYPIFMNNVGVQADIRPRIIHYMSSPKPWQGVFPPWQADARRPYDDIVRRYPQLKPYHARMAGKAWLRYQLQQRYKRVNETMSWRMSPRRARILNYENGLPALAAQAQA